MAIDHIIDYDCIPKQALTTEGIIERIKAEERAYTIIGLFRKNGDERPPSEMGFEFTRSTPEGSEEVQVIVVQDLLDEAEVLNSLAHHCEGCPANRTGKRFGCMGFVQYPITEEGEQWLIDRLPVPDEPLIWLLLKQGVKEFQYDGASVQPLREADQTYFEAPYGFTRKLGEFEISSNQVFEMIFAVGNILPNHAGILLLLFNAIARDLDANVIMNISPASENALEEHSFLLESDDSDDRTVAEFKDLLHAMYTAWRLNVRLILDV